MREDPGQRNPSPALCLIVAIGAALFKDFKTLKWFVLSEYSYNFQVAEHVEF